MAIERSGMKTVCVKIAGTGQEAGSGPLMVKPGTTASDLLKSCELKGYTIFKENGIEIKAKDDLYKAVDNGEVLYAASPAVVG